MVRILALAAALTLALAAPALGGGWAVTTLDNVPDRFDPGQTYAIGYTIRQHGVTPVSVDRTEIRITHGESGKRLAFAGTPQGAVGHYVAQVTFPAAGSWSWDVTQGPFAPQDLGTLAVGTTAAGAPASADAAPVVPAPVSATTAASGGPNGLLLSGLLIALAGAAVLFGGQLASARRPARA